MNPAFAAAFDIIACIFLALSLFGTVVLAPKRPLALSLFSLIFTVVLAIAVLSCSSAPAQLPEKAVTKSPCVVTLEAFCKKGSQCGYFNERECVAKGARECDTVQGITPTEAEVCAAALQKTSCRELVPVECMSIAEPVPPQPDSREL